MGDRFGFLYKLKEFGGLGCILEMFFAKGSNILLTYFL